MCLKAQSICLLLVVLVNQRCEGVWKYAVDVAAMKPAWSAALFLVHNAMAGDRVPARTCERHFSRRSGGKAAPKRRRRAHAYTRAGGRWARRMRQTGHRLGPCLQANRRPDARPEAESVLRAQTSHKAYPKSVQIPESELEDNFYYGFWDLSS